MKVGGDASIALAAVMEYMTAEVLELSGNSAKMCRKSRINNYHIFSAIGEDKELLNTLTYVHRNRLDFKGVRPKKIRAEIFKDDKYLDTRSPYECRGLNDEIMAKNMKCLEEQKKKYVGKKENEGGDNFEFNSDGEGSDYIDDYKIQESEYEFSVEEEEDQDKAPEPSIKRVESIQELKEDSSDDEECKIVDTKVDGGNLAHLFIGELEFEQSD